MEVGKGTSGDRGKADRSDPTKPNTNPGTNPDTKSPADASSTRGNPAGAEFDHSALIRDLARKCLQSETKMLSTKTGAEFDRAYMGMQVASHVRCADMLEVFKTYASPNLLPTLEAGQKTVAAHLEHAKTLCKQVEDGTTDNGAGGKAPRDGR